MAGSRRKRTVVSLLIAALMLPGCAGPNARLQYLIGDDSSLSHYEDMATAIEYPVEETPTETDPNLFMAPRRINDLNEVKHRKMSLNECVRLALSKGAILREDSSFGSPGNPLLANPSRVASVYDTAIQETSFLFGNRGPEAALSDFDALFTNNMQWGRAEDPQNSPFLNLDAGDTLTEESAQFSSKVEKPFANSSTFSVQHDWNYSANNVPSRLFPSAYTGFVQAEFRQPLLAGSGTEFTRIAGPIGQNLRGVSGVSQGVLISRINSDISLVDFEQSSATLVRDVERAYWDLYLFLRLYDSEIETARDLLRAWEQARGRADSGDPTEELFAKTRFYDMDARIKGSLADVLEKETRLRRLMGLTLNDGEFITPTDKPSEARLSIDWKSTLTEALAHRAELRRQKWEIRSLELQLKAAKNLSRPRLDFVSQYRVNGFGDQLFGEEDDDGITSQGYRSAYESITQGDNTTWNLGVSFSMPVGLRLARAQVRNYELRLTKARAVLSAQEKEIAYELNASLLEMDRWYAIADSAVKKSKHAELYAQGIQLRMENTNEKFRNPGIIQRVLDAKIDLRESDQTYLRGIIEYNKAIIDLNFRKGMTLQNHAVYLAEGEWNPMAYEEARKRAEATSHAIDNPHLKTVPLEFGGQPAPSAWESTGSPDRPFVPGVSSTSGTAVLSAPSEVPEVPDRPAIENEASPIDPMPAIPMNEDKAVPMFPEEPAIEVPPSPKKMAELSPESQTDSPSEVPAGSSGRATFQSVSETNTSDEKPAEPKLKQSLFRLSGPLKKSTSSSGSGLDRATGKPSLSGKSRL
ncbi:MAG: TolC family protein [Planctomyces sp.]|nr:TolC family protein [Planctomyces sp.]